jgi:hypothetical protein
MLRLAALALVLTASFPWMATAHDCRCIYDGGIAAQGKTVCIKTSKGYQLARCEMFLNNSSWKFLDEPCNQLQSRKPATLPKSG